MTNNARSFNGGKPIQTRYGYKTIIRSWFCKIPNCDYEAQSLKQLKEHKVDKHAY